VDEFGPLERRPYGGAAWRSRRKPLRFRATYTRPYGVRHLLAAYDVGRGRLWGHFKKRKRRGEFLVFLRAIRRRYRGPIWIVLDNFSPHRTHEVRQWAQANNVRFQFLPTNASWLNRIECHFTHLKKNTLTNCDYESFDEMRIAMHKYMTWYSRKHSRQLKLKQH
jgi:transposase